MIWTWGRSQHRRIDGWIFWSSMLFYWTICSQKGKCWKNPHILRYGEVILAYTWFNLNFTDQSSLFCGLSDMYCTSALAIEEGNAFESQNGVTVVQTSKVKWGGHCIRDFGHVPVLLKTWVFWTVLQTRTKPQVGVALSHMGLLLVFCLMVIIFPCCAC